MALDANNYIPALKYGATLQAAADLAIANTKILIGDSSGVAQEFALSGDATMTAGGVVTIAAAAVTRTKMSVPAASKGIHMVTPTIGTTGAAGTIDFLANEAGSLVSVDFNGVDALAANDTNYITFAVTNLGQAGAGSTAMLAATDANTTKSTGGTALSATTKRSLTVHGTAANLVVAAGDLIRIVVTATGTLANTVTVPKYVLRFGGTT